MSDLIKITKESGMPLIGCIAFGILDRGTNLLQIRPTTVCNLNCPFCSTDAGAKSRMHDVDFEVEPNYLVDELKKIINIKGCEIEANIDSVGETSSYPYLISLIDKIKNISKVSKISMQTNGTFLNKRILQKLAEAGLGRINLSIHSMDKEKAKLLSGSSNYNIDKIKSLAKEIKSRGIELCITPVYLPNINESDIEKIIEFAKEINASLGIQKYEIYKHSRKMKGAKMQNWWKFFRQLKELEKKYGIKLVINAADLGIKRCSRIPEVFSQNEKVYGIVKSKGWIKGQMIAVARDRCISINNCNTKIDSNVRIKILETKNNIYVADLITLR